MAHFTDHRYAIRSPSEPGPLIHFILILLKKKKQQANTALTNPVTVNPPPLFARIIPASSRRACLNDLAPHQPPPLVAIRRCLVQLTTCDLIYCILHIPVRHRPEPVKLYVKCPKTPFKPGRKFQFLVLFVLFCSFSMVD